MNSSKIGLPLNWLSVYVLPSSAGSVKSSAVLPLARSGSGCDVVLVPPVVPPLPGLAELQMANTIRATTTTATPVMMASTGRMRKPFLTGGLLRWPAELAGRAAVPVAPGLAADEPVGRVADRK